MNIGKKGTLITLLALVLASASYTMAAPSAEKIRHELVMLPMYSVFDNLEYRVDGDTVILQGQVTRPYLKSDAEAVVKRVSGVTAITNNIEVLPLSAIDDQIRLNIYYRLFKQSSSLMQYGVGAAPPIHIIVRNGNVRLVGTVNNEGDKMIAGTLANQVASTYKVTNDLTVGK